MSTTRSAPRPPHGGVQARHRVLLAVFGVLVAVVGLAAPTASADAATGTQNGVAAINIEPGTLVASRGPVSPAVVGVSGPVFDDGAVVSRVAPSLTSRAPQVLRVGDVKLSAVPKGAVGTPTQTGNGLQYSIKSGTPELDPRVTHVRIMDPVTTGKYQYPNGYAAYMNRSGQTVNPLTGETISNSHPFAHIPL